MGKKAVVVVPILGILLAFTPYSCRQRDLPASVDGFVSSYDCADA